MTEEQLHKQITDYIKIQYKNVIFTTDMSGVRLPAVLAVKTSKLRSGRGIPDILIFKTAGKLVVETTEYKNQVVFQFAGLFLEVKSKTPFLKNGELSKNQHIQEQAQIHKELRKQGYMTIFVWSFDQAKKVIDDYMKIF